MSLGCLARAQRWIQSDIIVKNQKRLSTGPANRTQDAAGKNVTMSPKIVIDPRRVVTVPIQNRVNGILAFMCEYICKEKKKEYFVLIAISSTKCLEFSYSYLFVA